MMQYMKLKQKALEAIENKKIFTVQGKNAFAVRKALLDRGWVEKRDPCQWSTDDPEVWLKLSSSERRENLMLSNLVEKCAPNLVWGEKNLKISQDCEKPIRNTLKVDRLWSTKARLCISLKNTSWNYIEDVAEVDAPRTYSNTNKDELREFINDYYLTACTSLIKWILANIQKKKPIFKDTGTISINVFIFAIKRCIHYLFKKENFDVDNNKCDHVTSDDWSLFLMKYRSIVSCKDLFRTDEGRNLPMLIAYAKCLLEKILKFRPQLRCEGCYNIWIIKPSDCSNGKGIVVSSELDRILDIVTDARKPYIVQKYIEEPLLVYETKFDIRQYCLITSTHPLKIWMYQDCFFKFCSQKYSLKCLHEAMHITTQAVQKRYKNSSDRHPGLPKNNFCDLNKYKNYLNVTGKEQLWDDVIYPRMKKIVIGIMLSSQDFFINSKNRFGFYCCDFILDKDYRPWLIEINKTHLFPSIEVTICHRVVSDIIKVVIDHSRNPEASTGQFARVYRQPMTPPLRICEYSANALQIKGVAILPHYYNNENEAKTTANIPHNVGNPAVKEWKTLSNPERVLKQPLLNIIHKLEKLLEISDIKIQDNDKHLNVSTDRKNTKFLMQTDLYWVIVPGSENFGLCDLDDNLDKKICVMPTESTVKTEPYHDDNFDDIETHDYMEQSASVWMTELYYIVLRLLLSEC